MVDGAFDPLHHGHIEYFKAARELGVPVLCNVASDRYVRTKHRPLLTETQRAAVIDAIRYIDYVHIYQIDTETVLRQLRPRYYVKGSDWRERGLPPEQDVICREHGIEIVYLDTVLDSSSRLLKDYFAQTGPTMTITEFEAAVFAQKPTGQQHYDENYWLGEWRAGDNNYSLETRRRIEAKNPQLIKDVFQPKRVIDLGCGPGALMHLLHEIGVEADGIDYNEMSLKLATPEVRDRIAIGDASDASIKSDGSYDLVICREVLEHLTVLEVKKAVANMVRLTSKFIYVTTRFHPNPPTLLDFNTSDDLDPSHITLLNKDMLRLMFVLEGCRSRPDLEDADGLGQEGPRARAGKGCEVKVRDPGCSSPRPMRPWSCSGWAMRLLGLPVQLSDSLGNMAKAAGPVARGSRLRRVLPGVVPPAVSVGAPEGAAHPVGWRLLHVVPRVARAAGGAAVWLCLRVVQPVDTGRCRRRCRSASRRSSEATRSWAPSSRRFRSTPS